MTKQRFYGSPRWTGEVLDCSMPMTFDQYSRCSYNCLYCFSFFQRGIRHLNWLLNSGGTRKLYTEERPDPVNVEALGKLFRGETNNMFSQYIADRYWMQWGGLSDPFDEFERQMGVGLQLLELFAELRYPVCFSTKGTWWTEDDRYMTLFARNRDIWNMKYSIINLDRDRSRAIEMGCPSPEERLEALETLAAVGVPVTLRLRPFIIGLSDVGDEYLELIRRAAAAGARAVSTEFFCVERRMTKDGRARFDRISEALGIDIVDFYRRNTPNATGYMRLNPKIKQPYVDKMEALCRRLRLRFYVSDAHHKDRCFNGSCCGLPETAKYHRGQFTEAIVIARRCGEVHFSDIRDHILPCFRTLRAVEAVNLVRGSPSQRARFYHYTMFDLIRYYWNSPNEAKSPYRYFGGALWPSGVDSEGDVVYVYRGYGDQ